VLTSLYCKLLEDSLNEYAYDAEVAGVAYSLSNTTTGASLKFGGYSHKLPLLIETIVRRMRELVVDPVRFALIKEQMTRGIKNFELEQPYQHAMYEQGLYLEHRNWSYKEKLAGQQQHSTAAALLAATLLPACSAASLTLCAVRCSDRAIDARAQ
jgi:insulysin